MDIDVPLILRRFMRVGVSLTATCGILLSLSGIPGLMGAMAMNKKKNNLLKNKKFREGLMNKNKEESEKLEKILTSLMNKEELGLPEECKFQNMEKEYIECSLSGKDLKKIKFGELGDKEGEVMVSSGDDVNVNLKILINRDFSMNYIFTNGTNEDIVISKGDNKVSLKASGETSFILDKETLVIEKLGDYGIPERCLKKNEILSLLIENENVKQCVLTQEELSNIKFNGFTDEGKSDVTKLWVGNENWEYDQVITLYFLGDKYIFDNYFPDLLEDKQKQWVHRPIKITRGDVSVTLEGNMDSEFTVVDGGLKKQEVTDLGFPKRCEIGDEQSKTCELSENEIKRLKLKETGVSPDIEYLDKSGGKINLKIEKTEEEGYTDGKKYILSSVDSGILITGTVELSEEKEMSEELKSKNGIFILINEEKEKVFKNESNQLVEVKDLKKEKTKS